MAPTLFLMLALNTVAAAPPPNDAKAIQGIWTLVKIEQRGKLVKKVRYRRARMHVKADTLLAIDADETTVSRYQLHTTVNPKQIDLIQATSAGNKHVIKGIYQLEGDRLRLCLTSPNEPRPSTFTTARDSLRLLLTFTRKRK